MTGTKLTGTVRVSEIDPKTGRVISESVKENTITNDGRNLAVAAAFATGASTAWATMNIIVDRNSGTDLTLSATRGGSGASVTFTATDSTAANAYSIDNLYLRQNGQTTNLATQGSQTQQKTSGNNLQITWTLTLSSGTGVNANMNTLIADKMRGGTGTSLAALDLVLADTDDQVRNDTDGVDTYESSSELTTAATSSGAVVTYTPSGTVASAGNGADRLLLADGNTVYAVLTLSTTPATGQTLGGSATFTLS